MRPGQQFNLLGAFKAAEMMPMSETTKKEEKPLTKEQQYWDRVGNLKDKEASKAAAEKWGNKIIERIDEKKETLARSQDLDAPESPGEELYGRFEKFKVNKR